MLDSLITSKMRVQILMRLFLNPDSHAYLRELSKDFNASPGDRAGYGFSDPVLKYGIPVIKF
mgnify:CR=1 FL=1